MAIRYFEDFKNWPTGIDCELAGNPFGFVVYGNNLGLTSAATTYYATWGHNTYKITTPVGYVVGTRDEKVSYTDCSVSLRFSTVNDSITLMLRNTSNTTGGPFNGFPSDGYVAQITPNATNGILIRRVAPSSFTTIATSESSGTDLSDFTCTFKIIGNELSLDVDGMAETLTATDSTYTSGYPGFYTGNGGNYISDYKVGDTLLNPIM